VKFSGLGQRDSIVSAQSPIATAVGGTTFAEGGRTRTMRREAAVPDPLTASPYHVTPVLAPESAPRQTCCMRLEVGPALIPIPPPRDRYL
jgi:hypothetical protein